MRKRIVVVVAGMLLAMLGVVPATPASAAAAKECRNVPKAPATAVANTCIAWDDNPAGPNWTLYQTKVTNTGGTWPTVLNAFVRYNNGGSDGHIHTIGDGATLTLNIAPPAVGPSTAMFLIWPQGRPDLGWCNYRTPHGGDFTEDCVIEIVTDSTVIASAR